MRALALVWAVLAWALLCAPAAARTLQPDEIATTCAAASTPDEPLARVVADRSRWRCDESIADISPERIVLRYELSETAPVPSWFVLRRSALDTVTAGLIDRDGKITAKAYRLRDLTPAGTDGFVAAPLPSMQSADAVIVAIDAPTTPALVLRSRLATHDPATESAWLKDYILIGGIVGLLLLPFLFNFAFYRVLKEQFLLWHSLLAVAMMLAVSTSSNLAAVMWGVPIDWVSTGSTLGFGATVAAGSMFAWSFIEPGKLHPLLRRALPWIAGWSLLLSTLHAAFPFVARGVQLDAYLIGFLPVLLILLAVLFDALRRGSRAAIFQLVGWGPLIMVGVVRQIAYLTPFIGQTDAMPMFYFGCAFEVLATALGVADRMMLIKVERDQAQSAARELEHLAERDGLTGLLNRRAVEMRFDSLRAEGFDTLALLDLDRFKDINDRFGHHVGDEVLVVAAAAMRDGNARDSLAVRMGGEEFLLLLRGADTMNRVERLRCAIPGRVAAQVEGLDRPVTASMGVVEIPRDGLSGMDFDSLYRRADQLLYEAKEAGRNRSVYERLQLFAPPVRSPSAVATV